MNKFFAASGRGALWLVAGVLIGSALAGGVAYATVPDPAAVIHGCYQVDAKGNVNTNATLRIIDLASPHKEAQACKSTEAPLNWNQTGTTGPQGPMGAPGGGVNVTSLAVGSTNCPAGGTEFTDAVGHVSYACSAPTQSLDVIYVDQTGTLTGGATSGGELATCPSGYKLVGGGASADQREVEVQASLPASEWGPGQTPLLSAPWGTASQWGANFYEPPDLTSTVRTVSVAICARLVTNQP